jgi:hypothetical protein
MKGDAMNAPQSDSGPSTGAFAPRTRWVLAFVLAYVAAAIGSAVYYWNPEFIFYSLAVVLIIAVIGTMDRRVQFSQLVLWGLAIWGLAHLAGGQMPIPLELTEPDKSSVLYNLRLAPWLPKYDQIIHAYGFGMSVIAAHEAMSAHFGRALHVGWAVGSMLFLIGLGLGAVNEIIEFSAVLAVPLLATHGVVGGFAAAAVGEVLLVGITWRLTVDRSAAPRLVPA